MASAGVVIPPVLLLLLFREGPTEGYDTYKT